mgnify:CR=1 FL=1
MLIYLFMLESDEEKHLFKELYERYGNAMLRVAQRYFPSDLTAAEDAVQNAWLKVIKNFSKIQEDSSNKRGAYLVTIVKNESISLLRKQRQDISLDEMLVAEQENTTEDSKSSIIEIIRNMPEVYRAVLELRFVEELSTREISKLLHLSESAINTRIHRGRALLIKKLREEGYVR